MEGATPAVGDAAMQTEQPPKPARVARPVAPYRAYNSTTKEFVESAMLLVLSTHDVR